MLIVERYFRIRSWSRVVEKFDYSDVSAIENKKETHIKLKN
jgi:hypothetical protein